MAKVQHALIRSLVFWVSTEGHDRERDANHHGGETAKNAAYELVEVPSLVCSAIQNRKHAIVQATSTHFQPGW